MLDEIDYGMLLVADDLHLLHANHVARAELDAEHPLQALGRELRARQPHDVAPLHAALTDACRRRLRRLVTLGDGSQRVCLAVVPIPAPGDATPTSALVMLGKRQVCQELSVEAFARAHALTPAETQVLKALCSGARPGEIALQHSVALSTVRSQVGSIRAKTGAETIGALVRMVALLPPMVGALRRSLAAVAIANRPVQWPLATDACALGAGLTRKGRRRREPHRMPTAKVQRAAAFTHAALSEFQRAGRAWRGAPIPQGDPDREGDTAIRCHIILTGPCARTR